MNSNSVFAALLLFLSALHASTHVVRQKIGWILNIKTEISCMFFDCAKLSCLVDDYFHQYIDFFSIRMRVIFLENYKKKLK